jgi:hypothetical protein
MSLSAEPAPSGLNAISEGWFRLWHVPVRAERLGLMRLLLGLALLSEQFFQFLPNLPELYGPHGISPAGLRTSGWLADWRWTLLFFSTDDLPTVYLVFWLWVAATAAFTAGLFTRFASIAVWLLTLAFINRTRFLLNSGTDMMQIALFLLMLSPCGQALSVDAWLRPQAGPRSGNAADGPAYTPPWAVRLIQFQLIIVYFSSGLLKLQGNPGLFEGTWYEGSSVHYTLNFVDRARWAYAQFPLPFWFTALLTYTTLAWEALFPFLLFTRPTRCLALVMGVLFHVGIFIVLDLGWFCLYALCYYAVWVPDEFWACLDGKREQEAPAQPAT